MIRRTEQQQEDEDYDTIEDGRKPQHEVKEVVAAILMTGEVGDIHPSSKDESSELANRDPSPEPSEDKLGSDSCSDDEFNNNPKSDKDDGRRGQVLSGNNYPYPAMAQHKRSGSTILSRGLSANIDHTPNSIDTIRNHTLLLVRAQESP